MCKDSIKDSIVEIKAPLGDRTGSNFGTGFIIYTDISHTYILTCYHVVGNRKTKEVSQAITVHILDDGQHREATFLEDYSDSNFDLAILRVERLDNLSPLLLNLSSSQRIRGELRFSSFGYSSEKELGGGITHG